MIGAVLDEPQDSIWDELISCADGTQSASVRAEALRIAAMWENLRASGFRRQVIAEKYVPATACSDLGKLETQMKTARDTMLETHTMSSEVYQELSNALNRCAGESRRMNISRPRSEEAEAWFLLLTLDSTFKGATIGRMAAEYNQLLSHDEELTGRYNTLVRNYNDLLDHALQNVTANDTFVRSLRQRAALQSLQRTQLTCSGTSYSVGRVLSE